MYVDIVISNVFNLNKLFLLLLLLLSFSFLPPLIGEGWSGL